jgi:hypothetical protein
MTREITIIEGHALTIPGGEAHDQLQYSSLVMRMAFSIHGIVVLVRVVSSGEIFALCHRFF